MWASEWKLDHIVTTVIQNKLGLQNLFKKSAQHIDLYLTLDLYISNIDVVSVVE